MLFDGEGETVQSTESEAVSECGPGTLGVLLCPFLVDLSHGVCHPAPVVMGNLINFHPISVVEQESAYVMIVFGTSLNDVDISITGGQGCQGYQIWLVGWSYQMCIS